MNGPSCCPFLRQGSQGDLNSVPRGRVHHVFYIFLLLWLLHNNLTTWFAVAMVEELPTVVLGCWRVR